MDDDSLEIVLALIKQLEATLRAVKQLCGYVGPGVGQRMFEELIEEGKTNLAEIKGKLTQ
jgi:hypothetical protein